MATVGYVRVSVLAGNTDRQLDGIQLDKVYEDKLSGKDMARPELNAMIDYVREGDTVMVHSIDRLARNLVDLKSIVAKLTNKGVTVIFSKENLTFKGKPQKDGKPDPEFKSDAMSDLVFSMMGAFAEFERRLINERQKEGHAIRKAKGLPIGRPAALTPVQIKAIQERAAAGESKTALAHEFGASRATIYTVLKAA